MTRIQAINEEILRFEKLLKTAYTMRRNMSTIEQSYSGIEDVIKYIGDKILFLGGLLEDE